MATPLITLEKLRREFPAGEDTIAVLKDIDLKIDAGEMVAIVGASGSGKSTLMNILGCLDRPTAGSYRISGQETSALEPDQLAALRREHFGFIFQRYHLLSELTALGNVEIPAIYAGQPPAEREERAEELLARLGMADRLEHRPGQLSGGQQQRVSIARALMNGAQVILADEPTGALDKHSGEEVLKILEELNREGKTVILVTHDMNVAARAERIIEISDGEIISDTRSRKADGQTIAGEIAQDRRRGRVRAAIDRFGEAFRMALLSMRAHKLRTFLTMLGIIIGIASVVCVVALGAGSRQQVLSQISSLGTNTLEVFPGKDFGDVRSGKITTLVVSDADALAGQPYVAAVTPTVSTSANVRFGSIEASALVNGVGAQYFEARGTTLAAGSFFNQESVRRLEKDVVIDDNTRQSLFADFDGSPVGQVILVGKVPCRIVGVAGAQQSGFGSSSNLNLYLPYTTVQARFLGDQSLRSITVRVADDTSTDTAEQAVTELLTRRHGSKDFFILNTDDIRQTITATTETLTVLIASIALISLIVGGIGVMNIMLVSVSERINEIGVRMAVGARQSDILQQFLIEGVLVCLIGGVLGIALALAFGTLFDALGSSFTLIYSPVSIVAAFLCSSLIGIVFGYLPARNASRLDPVAALARD
ncbi:macrolide transport system ATP-binding/permease protein [Rhodopseudomonas julia]|uniref:Pyoverdine export ATP-binding/permease protein PvdT n=1 Tax=Rhodopseudomonas julia TaxID=200617 RepID=A0ABU0CA77_9BRAD|nr:MacB family efflux pump subunit [Rhodopseudomonas julia]MDQ0327433.1 macrolide transport system ATP-binding/permease protein [Rhodopseudomonas julia]